MANPFTRMKDPDWDSKQEQYKEMTQWANAARSRVFSFTAQRTVTPEELANYKARAASTYTKNTEPTAGKPALPDKVLLDVASVHRHTLEGASEGRHINSYIPDTVVGLGLAYLCSSIITDKVVSLTELKTADSFYQKDRGVLTILVATASNIPEPIKGQPYQLGSIMDKETRDSFDKLLTAAETIRVVSNRQLPQMRKDRNAYASHIEAAAALEGPNAIAQDKLNELDATILATVQRLEQMNAALYRSMAALQASVRQAKRVRDAKHSATVLSQHEPTQVQVANLDLDTLVSVEELEGEKALRLEEVADAIEAGEPIPQVERRIAVKSATRQNDPNHSVER
jgi:hypothetical protein